MSLNLHSGGEIISYADLAEVKTPPATASHVPIPHADLVKMVKFALSFYGHEVTEEYHAIDRGGDRYFGLLHLKSDYGPYVDTVGLRNSSDKTFPIGIALGAQVFVCSNLSFHGTHVIKRKHTANAKRDLPGLVAEIIEPMKERRLAQFETFNLYQKVKLNPQIADHTILNLWREGIINLTQIDDVVHEWEEPTHDWNRGTAYHLFNATTFVLTGRVAENPATTTKLHRVLDGVCERLN